MLTSSLTCRLAGLSASVAVAKRPSGVMACSLQPRSSQIQFGDPLGKRSWPTMMYVGTA